MLQLRKKILAGVLCSALVLSAGQSVAMSESPTTEAAADATEEAAAVESEELVTNTGAASVTEEEALAQYELCADNGQNTLYVSKSTGSFVVKNNKTGFCWWSNPYNAAADGGAKGSNLDGLNSPLVIESVKVTDTEAPSTTLRSVADADTTVVNIDNGFKATCVFPDEGITVPYSVVLDGDHFNVSVHLDEIVETEMQGVNTESIRSVVKISLFKDLGAGSPSEQGYIITPDGSGAVINFNNGKNKTTSYSQKLYGRDVAISQDMAPAKTEQAYLPVLGIVKEDNALMAVISEGSAYATVRASVNGQDASAYNSAWFDFNLRSVDSYFMGQSNAALDAYELSKIPESTITVQYYPIAKDDADYVDVALRYQQYLVDNGTLTTGKAPADSAPFYLDLYGGTVKQQSVAGFPVTLQTPATTYEEAKFIIEELANRGIDDMIITYEDFNKAGVTSRISDGVDYAGKLGGKNAFNDLASYCAGIGATLAPSVDIQEYERSGNGYTKTGSSCIRVTKAYATQNEYERAFGTPHDTRTSWYIMTPAYYTKAVQSIVADYVSEGLTAISLEQATNMLYSDFTANTNKKTSRQQAVSYLQQCYQMINDSGLTFVADACNDYALKYVDYIRNVPLYSSNFDVYDYDIPFYEIVIHGYIPYTTKAKNASSNADELLLLSVATGTPVHYEVMHENPNEFTDSAYDTLFYAYYEGWLDIAAEEYKFVQQNIKSLSDKTITDFEYVDKNNIKTTFSDGTVIEADLANNTLKINGSAVSLPNID